MAQPPFRGQRLYEERAMAQQSENAAIDRLAVFVGEWGMAAEFKDLPPADIGARVISE